MSTDAPQISATPPQNLNPRYTDVMIDVEGLSENSDACPYEIALVFFMRDDPSAPFGLHTYFPSPESGFALELTSSQSTQLWMLSREITVDYDTGMPIREVLEQIRCDLTKRAVPLDALRIWARGTDYDISILNLAYRRISQEPPWQYWKTRDVRTYLEACRYTSPRKNTHRALEDALNQARDVIDATFSRHFTHILESKDASPGTIKKPGSPIPRFTWNTPAQP